MINLFEVNISDENIPEFVKDGKIHGLKEVVEILERECNPSIRGNNGVVYYKRVNLEEMDYLFDTVSGVWSDTRFVRENKGLLPKDVKRILTLYCRFAGNIIYRSITENRSDKK